MRDHHDLIITAHLGWTMLTYVVLMRPLICAA
jgi:hypothetical protein